MIKRRKTKTVSIGNVKIGADHPVVIQSMAKTLTSDVNATVEQIHRLEGAGCEIVRVAVKDNADAKAISDIKQEIKIPLIADIHFDHELAIEAVKRGADKIRVNPGNIYKPHEVDKIIDAAALKKIPIRIGVNSGSLRESEGVSGDAAGKMVKSALKYLEHFKKRRFDDIIVSLKASDVPITVEAYRRIAKECEYPLHLGVTAAGLPADGTVKSSAGIGALLLDGIGDTVRVSLTGDPAGEVDIAKRILSYVGVRRFGPNVISCPTCGRCRVDLVSIVKDLESMLKRGTRKDLTVAIMGCEVNGPGEAEEADIGIAFGKEKGAIFKRGEIIKTVKAEQAVGELLRIIEQL